MDDAKAVEHQIDNTADDSAVNTVEQLEEEKEEGMKLNYIVFMPDDNRFNFKAN